MRIKRRRSINEIVAALRRIDQMVAGGQRLTDVLRQEQVTAMTFYRWRKRYAGLSDDQVEWLADMQAQIADLRKFVANLTDENRILSAVSRELLADPAARRARVDHVVAMLGVSERRACQALGQHRSTQRKVMKSAKVANGQRRDADRSTSIRLGIE
ncbi:transposase [Pseudorhodoplanes sp.]|uniref:transposase n=1 Tax=Pseudorhodoplanes sp. TaxID=1934341 RepID=UPI003D11E4FA